MNVFKDFIPIRIFELTLAIDLPDEIEDEIPKKRIRERFLKIDTENDSENGFKMVNQSFSLIEHFKVNFVA